MDGANAHAESASRNCCILRFLAMDDGELGRTVSVAEVCAISFRYYIFLFQSMAENQKLLSTLESKSKGRMMEREVGRWEELRNEGKQKLQKRHEF